MTASITADWLAALSRHFDHANRHRPTEAVTWGRLAKIAEENGEVIAAWIGATGQNPRKGITHAVGDVIAELLDVAVTALGAVEHLTGNNGACLDLLDRRVAYVSRRAGLEPEGAA